MKLRLSAGWAVQIRRSVYTRAAYIVRSESATDAVCCRHMTTALPGASSPPLWVGYQPPTSNTVKHTSLFTQLYDDPSATN